MRPFWIHQLAEYLIGVALIATGMQSPDPVVPSFVGVLVMCNTAIVRGPVGAFRLVGRRLHRWLDLVVMAAILVAAVQPWFDIDTTSRATMLLVLLPLGFLWFYTDWAERPSRAQRRLDRAGDTSEAIGRSAGRIAGNLASSIKRRAER
jgi:hypothetical protein